MTESLVANGSPSAFREFKHVRLARVTVLEGAGVEGDPMRNVNYYFTEDGELLWCDDYWIRTDWPRLEDFPDWALARVAESLGGQGHNPAIRSLLHAIQRLQERRKIEAPQ